MPAANGGCRVNHIIIGDAARHDADRGFADAFNEPRRIAPFRSIAMSARTSRLITVLTLVLVSVPFLIIAFQLASIQLRLWRNGTIAAELDESLSNRFPGMKFR